MNVWIRKHQCLCECCVWCRSCVSAFSFAHNQRKFGDDFFLGISANVLLHAEVDRICVWTKHQSPLSNRAATNLTLAAVYISVCATKYIYLSKSGVCGLDPASVFVRLWALPSFRKRSMFLIVWSRRCKQYL